MVDLELLEYLESFVSDKRKETFKKVLSQRTKHFTVVLEDLYQKHNTSAVVRSCDIFGIQDVHIIENKYESYMSNQVGKGSQKWMDFYRYNQKQNNTSDCIDELKSQGYQVIVTTPHNDSCILEDFDISKKSAFVFGVEKEGVSELAMSKADGFLKIPMVGFTESLNVSVAAAIVLQSLTAKLKASDKNWQMSEEEVTKKYLDWVTLSIKDVDRIKERFYKDKK